MAGAASNQEQLAVAAQNAVRTIVNLSDAVKNGAVSLSSDNAEAQVMIIHAGRLFNFVFYFLAMKKRLIF